MSHENPESRDHHPDEVTLVEALPGLLTMFHKSVGFSSQRQEVSQVRAQIAPAVQSVQSAKLSGNQPSSLGLLKAPHPMRLAFLS